MATLLRGAVNSRGDKGDWPKHLTLFRHPRGMGKCQSGETHIIHEY